MVLELVLHAGAEFLVCWKIDASWERFGGGSIAGLSIGLSIDVFTGNSLDVAGIAFKRNAHRRD